MIGNMPHFQFLLIKLGYCGQNANVKPLEFFLTPAKIISPKPKAIHTWRDD